MRSCQESAEYLHSLGISDQKLADACGIQSLSYMNLVRNGKRAGGSELQATLNALCEQAIERNLPLKNSSQTQVKRIARPPTHFIDAIPSSGYSTSQEVIPYTPEQEAPVKNRQAPHPIYDNPSNLPDIQNTRPPAYTPQTHAFEQARANLKGSLIPYPVNLPDASSYRNTSPAPYQNTPIQLSPQISEAPKRLSTWQRIKAAYREGCEVERQDREAHKRR